MGTLTTKLTNTCSGGGHFVLSLTGDKTATVPATRAELSEPIEASDLVSFVKVVIRLTKIGKTVPETISALQAGVTVNV